MSDYHQCDIWLSESAHHAQDGQRHKRPIVIISSDKYNESNDEIICLHLTTRLDHENAISLIKSDFEKSHLVDDSAVRFDSITRYSKNVLSKKLGEIKREKLRQIVAKTVELIKT